MEQKWYKKAAVQAAIVGGFFLLIGIIIPNLLQIPRLNERINQLQNENNAKNFKIQSLEAEVAPFKTIALERFTGTEEEALSKLAVQLKTIENALLDVKKYTYVSTLNVLGYPFDMAALSTPVAHLMADVFLVNKETREISVRCDETAITKCKEAIKIDGSFPFSYYALAICFDGKDNTVANDFAKKALEILEVTTTIDGHHSDHDVGLKHLRKLFPN